jgi:Sigma-70, region 4
LLWTFVYLVVRNLLLLGVSRERVRQLETEALKRLAQLRESEWAAG